MTMDKLDSMKDSSKGLSVAALPVKDEILGFWGSIHEYVYDYESKDIILCGKSLERLELYIRLKYRRELIEREFDRLCRILSRIPKDTPYRYNSSQLSVLVEIIESEEGGSGYESELLSAISRLFDPVYV
jgi:hypothetical protein